MEMETTFEKQISFTESHLNNVKNDITSEND